MSSTGEAWKLLPGRFHSLPGKECYLLGKPGKCLSGRSPSLLGMSAISWGSWGTACLRRPGIACLGTCTLCLRKSAICWGSWGIACLRECTLCLGRSAVCWGSLGIACPGDSAQGKSTICLGSLRGSPRS